MFCVAYRLKSGPYSRQVAVGVLLSVPLTGKSSSDGLRMTWYTPLSANHRPRITQRLRRICTNLGARLNARVASTRCAPPQTRARPEPRHAKAEEAALFAGLWQPSSRGAPTYCFHLHVLARHARALYASYSRLNPAIAAMRSRRSRSFTSAVALGFSLNQRLNSATAIAMASR